MPGDNMYNSLRLLSHMEVIICIESKVSVNLTWSSNSSVLNIKKTRACAPVSTPDEFIYEANMNYVTYKIIYILQIS